MWGAIPLGCGAEIFAKFRRHYGHRYLRGKPACGAARNGAGRKFQICLASIHPYVPAQLPFVVTGRRKLARLVQAYSPICQPGTKTDRITRTINEPPN